MIYFSHGVKAIKSILLGFVDCCNVYETITKVDLLYKRKGYLMKKGKLKKIICLALVALTTVLSSTVSAKAAVDEGRIHINNTYGYFVTRTYGVYDADLGEKLYTTCADTMVAVPRIRAYMKVMYAKSGDRLGEENTGWIYNDDHAYTCTFEMHHFRNKETGVYDGFVNTKCAVYGTGDVITDKAYAVYTSLVY